MCPLSRSLAIIRQHRATPVIMLISYISYMELLRLFFHLDQQEYMQQRFGNRADLKHESFVPGIPSELCYDASGQEQQEMITLEPAAPNLNANYGNYMEDPQHRDHSIIPIYQAWSFYSQILRKSE
jgi:hypothetical protein